MTQRDRRMFDGYMAVDWSANGTPKTGADSIWISCRGHGGDPVLANPPTRREAVDRIAALLEAATGAGRRMLCGFDFPFGFPEGTTHAITGTDDWQALWRHIWSLLEEGERNANNRFDVAASLNSAFAAEGPFWGNGLSRDVPGLPRRKPTAGWGEALPPNRREAEHLVRSAQEVWKLNGVGSVGGQALTGIAALEGLRRTCGARIWPFETLGEGTDHVFAEIYPSLLEPMPGDAPKDARQVLAVTATMEQSDLSGGLRQHLAAPANMPVQVRREEALILGMDDPEAFRGTSTPATLDYIRDPAAIYARSFATIREEVDLSSLPPDVAEMAIRLVHACGMTDVAAALRFSPGAVGAGRAALLRGAPVLCDAEMVARGVIGRALPETCETIVTLNDPGVPALAQELATTRSAAAVDLWRDRLEGAVVAIGNAPTALFHLLEMIEEGGPRPAVILGFPVGFVGAAESKQALSRRAHGVPFVTLPGRRGGSAMAAAAVNALTLGLNGDGT